MKGKKAGNKSIMNRGTEINNQATAPQSVSPRDAKMINFFFVDSSKSFIHCLSANRCFTWHMLYALRAGWYPDRREGNKKSAARKDQAALLLKLALEAPLSGKVVERTSERRTDVRERAGLLASCGRGQTQQDIRKHQTYQHHDNKHHKQDFANS